MRQIMIALLAASSLALAADLNDARAQYAKGDFQGATATALSLKTADGFALAARANSIYASTLPEARQADQYDKSDDYARQAIKLDAKNVEGYFELARALGRISQLRGVLNALVQGIGTQIKQNLDRALELNPRHASSMVALGLWHAEIVSKGVGWLYGADGGKVAPLMEAAIKLEPDQVIHRVEYARALILLDANRNKAKAIDLLEDAVKLKPSDAAEALDLERAKRDLAALKK